MVVWQIIAQEQHRALPGRLAAIDSKHLTVDIAGSIGGEEEDGGRQFAGLADTLHWQSIGNQRFGPIEDCFRHTRSKHTRGDGIDAHTALTPLYRQSTCEVNDRGLTGIVADGM